MAGLSRHLVSLRLDNMTAELMADQFVAICGLTKLTELQLACTINGKAEVYGTDHIPPQISQLCRLHTLQIMSGADNDSIYISVPTELTLLQALEYMTISEVADGGMAAIGRLSNLTCLDVSAQGQAAIMDLPEAWPGLTGLRQLNLDSVDFEASVQALAQLSSLLALRLWYVTFEAETEELARVAGKLTRLTHLDISHSDVAGVINALP